MHFFILITRTFSRDESNYATTATTENPSMRILLFLLLLLCLPLLLLFCYFVFSLYLRLLLPSLRLLHHRLFLILTHGAHGPHALTRRQE